MRLIVDGTVYGLQAHGGINTLFNSVLPLLVKNFGVKVKLLLPRAVMADPPDQRVLKARRFLLPEKTGLSWKLDNWVYGPIARHVNMANLNRHVKLQRETLYQSTYFTWINSNVPQVAIVYDLNHELLPKYYAGRWGGWLKKTYREYVKHATRIIAISAKTKADVTRFYNVDPDKIDIAHLAVDQSRFYRGTDQMSDLGLPEEWIGRYYLFVGPRRGYKNFEVLAKAISKLPSVECPGVVVVGPELTDKEYKQLRQLSIVERVRSVVYPDTNTLRRLYASSRAFVYPSRHEGFGIPLLEAMACETAVLAADTQVFREIAGDAALYFDPDSENSLTAMINILTDDLRISLIELGRANLNRFSWKNCATAFYTTYLCALEEYSPERISY